MTILELLSAMVQRLETLRVEVFYYYYYYYSTSMALRSRSEVEESTLLELSLEA